MILIGRYVLGFKLIDDYDLLVDYLEFIEKVSHPSISCDDRILCFGTLAFESIETLYMFMSIGIGLMNFYLAPDIVFS